MEMRRIPCQSACVEYVIRRVTAGWRAWVRLAMKTRTEHSSGVPADPRGRPTRAQRPTRSFVVPLTDSIVQPAADETPQRREGERAPLRFRAGQGFLVVKGWHLACSAVSRWPGRWVSPASAPTAYQCSVSR